MEQKTVEQMAVELYPNRVDAALFLNGVSYAQQSQPMWWEIDRNEEYDCIFAKWKETYVHWIDWCVDGSWLINNGYTHYLSSEDLLRLPTEKK